MIQVLLVNALFSLVFPLGKIAMNYSTPFFVIGLRMFLTGLLLLGYWSLFCIKKEIHFSKSILWRIILLAIFNIFLTNSCEFWGLQYMSSAKTCFIYNLAPFFSAIFGYLHFEERMTLKKWSGLLISFFGFLPIMVAPAPEEIGLFHIGPFSLAEIALLVATISSVYGWIVMQDIVRRRRFNAIFANGLSMVIGGLFSFGTSSIIEWHYWQPIPLMQWWPLLFWLGIIIICTLIIFTLYAELLKKYTATFMSFSGLTGPIFAAFYDWVFFGSLVSWHFYVATFLVFVGLYIFYQEDLRQGYLVS